MASHAYSYKKFWYVDCEIVSPKVPNNPKIIQMPVVRGDSPTTKHKHNLRELFNRIHSNPSTLADIGIDNALVEKALTAMASAAMASVRDTGLVSLSFLSEAGVTKVMMRKQVEERLIKKRSAQLVEKAYHELKEKAKQKTKL
jgi:hypothetical protein